MYCHFGAWLLASRMRRVFPVHASLRVTLTVSAYSCNALARILCTHNSKPEPFMVCGHPSVMKLGVCNYYLYGLSFCLFRRKLGTRTVTEET